MLVLSLFHTQYPSAFLFQGGMLGLSLQESANPAGIKQGIQFFCGTTGDPCMKALKDVLASTFLY